VKVTLEHYFADRRSGALGSGRVHSLDVV